MRYCKNIKNANVKSNKYTKLDVKMTNAFHDRFMVLDDKTVYHIGASIKDAGKKSFGKCKKVMLNHMEKD